jgi:hypothetical protein
MSKFTVEANSTGGYIDPVATTTKGSSTSMTLIDKTTGTIASILDQGLHHFVLALCVWNIANDAGTGTVLPASSAASVSGALPTACSLPSKLPGGSVIVNSWVKSSKALVGSGNVTIQTSAGSSAGSILATTAVSTFNANDHIIQGAITQATPIVMTAAGNIEFVFSGTVTAGILEVILQVVIPVVP